MNEKIRTTSKNEKMPPIMGQDIKTETWRYPPTRSRRTGKARNKYDLKHFIHFKSSMFKHPVIMMSDMHTHAFEVVQKLADKVDLSKYLVLSTGDMAGEAYFGSDGDPTETYAFLAEQSKLFYFVQGNHDLPHPEGKHLELTNADGTKCMIQDRQKVNTPIGKIAGLNGTISRKPHPYKSPPSEFWGNLARMFHENNDISILMTHETPKLPIGSKYIGKERLFEMVARYKPKVHLYGHCFHPSPISIIDNVTFINADARILVIDPI